jgi:glutathione S-transferase
MAAARVKLLQFPYSHFNEKARWALDHKRVPHRRINLLPGPHMRPIRRLTGQPLVPVVRFGEEVVFGSAQIIDELERRYPERPLHPADAALRERALEIQSWFDDEVGPRIRRALFSVRLRESGYVCRMFSTGHALPVRILYRMMLPLVAPAMKKSMGLDDAAAVEDGFAWTEKALDFVAKEAGPEGYLVGGAFSVADLAAAALLAPACNPPDSPMTRPEPLPAGVLAWQERWVGHPGTAWVLARYRSDRPASCEVT